MKKIYSISLMFLFSFIANSQVVIWNAPITVASSYSNIYPRLALMTGDKPLVIWQNSGTDKVYRSRWTGSAFTTPLPVHGPGVIPFIATWAGAEVAASGDTAFIVFSTQPAMTGKVYSVRTINAGITFDDTVRADQIPGDIPRFPAVAVGPGGNPVINFMTIDSTTMGNAEYAVTHSTDGGLTYSSTSIPSSGAPGTVCDCCPASMAVKDNKEIVMYRNNISNLRNMWASFSTDGGATFPASAEIDQSNWMIMSCPSSGPSGIISGDSLISTWMSEGTTGDPKIYIGTMNISDQQIGLNRILYPYGTTTQNFPVMAGNGDTIGIVWQGYNAGLQDVLFTYSLTGAAGLGINVDTLTAGTTGVQSRPDIEYKNGAFHVVYSDSNGNNVKYMKGNISVVSGISEITQPSFSITSYYQNNSIDLRISSEEDCNAICEVMNVTGKKIHASTLQINKGRNELNIPAAYSAGIYFINIITSVGKISQSKVVITK